MCVCLSLWCVVCQQCINLVSVLCGWYFCVVCCLPVVCQTRSLCHVCGLSVCCVVSGVSVCCMWSFCVMCNLCQWCVGPGQCVMCGLSVVCVVCQWYVRPGQCMIIIIDNFYIALFSGVPKLTALYNILQHFLSFTNVIHIIMTTNKYMCHTRSSDI